MAYTIAQGDTLSGIAAKNNTTVQNLMQYNPNITDPNKIYAGQSLNLTAPVGVQAKYPSTSTISNSLPSGQQAPTIGSQVSSILPNLAVNPNANATNNQPATIPAIPPVNLNQAFGSGGLTYTAGPTLPQLAKTNMQSTPTTGGSNTTFQQNAGTTFNQGGTTQQQPVLNTPTAPPVPQQQPAFQQNVGALTGFGAGQESPEVTAARKDLADLQAKYAQDTGNIAGTAGFLTQQTGEQGILNQKYSTLLEAAQTRLQNALASQGQQIGAAGTAGQLTAPQAYQPTNVPFYPGQGYGQTASTQFGGQGGGGLYGLGGLLQTENLGAQSANWQAASQQGQNLGSQLSTLLTANPDINTLFGQTKGALTFTPATGLIQLGQNYLGNPTYQQFSNLLNELTNTYAQVLTPAGGNVTDMKTQIAQSMINPNATPQSILKVIQGLEQQAQAKIAGSQQASQIISGGTAGGANQNQYAFGNTFQ